MKTCLKTLTRVLYGVCLIITAQTMAQTAQKESKAFSVKEAQDYAVKNSYQVKMSAMDVDIARKKIWETTAIGLPQVKGSASYNDMLDIPTTLLPDFISPAVYGVLLKEHLISPSQMPDPSQMQYFPAKFGTQHNMSLDLTASLLLFNGAYIVGLQASRIYLDLSKQSLEKSEKEIKLNVTKSYYLVLVAKENKTILDSSYAVIQRTLSEIEAMNKQGFVEETDVDQMRITASNLQSTLNMLTRQIEIAERLLKFQMGIELDQPITLTDNLETILAQTNLSALGETPVDIKSQPDYKLALTQEKLSYLNLKREQTTLLPTLTTFFTRQEKAMRNEFDIFKSGKDWYPTTIFGVGLDVPIFSSGSRISKIQQAKLAYHKSQVLRTQIEEGLKLDVLQSKNEYSVAFEKYLNMRQSYELAKKIYNRTLIKYKAGVAGSFELTQANSQYLTTQSNYYNALLELLNAKVKLDKVLNNL